MHKVVTRESLIALLAREDIAMHVVGRALVHLKDRQTMDEKLAETTKHHNNRGFMPCDAKMGTSMATQYFFKKTLSPKQVYYWTKPNVKGVPRIAKYWAQLNEEAQKKEMA